MFISWRGVLSVALASISIFIEVIYSFNLVNFQERCSLVGVALAFISVSSWWHVMAFILLLGFVIVLAWGRAVSCAPRTTGLLLQSMRAPLHVLVVLLCVVVGASSVF